MKIPSMLSRPLAGVLASALLLASSPAYALDLTSYVQATIQFTKASTLRKEEKDEEADRHRNAGTAWLVAGLVLDTVGLIVIASTGADRVERLEAELAAGRGPILEAYAAATGLSPDEMAGRMRAALGAATGSSDDVDLEVLEQALADASLDREQAATWLYELHRESGLVGVGPTPRHQALAQMTAVSVDAVAASVSAVLELRFEGATVPGKVISARSVLAQDSVGTLNAVVDRLYGDHQAAIDAHLASLASGL